MERNNKGQFKQLSNDEFLKRISNSLDVIKILSEYHGVKSKIKCECKKCGKQWETEAKNLMRGNGCPLCNKSNPRLTTEQYKAQLKVKNPNVIIIGEYIGNGNKINCKCAVCGYEWFPFASSIKSGHGCPNCKALKDRLTNEEFKKRVEKNNPSFKILGEYKRHDIDIKVQCLKCNQIFLANPSRLMKGKNVCRECYKKSLLISNEEYKKRLKKNNPYVLYIEEYKGTDTKIEVKCSVCGNIWKSSPAKTLNGGGCPLCCLSKGEKEIAKILKKYDIVYVQQQEYKNLIGVGRGKLSYDFYLPDYNMLIEYQGKQHEIPIKYFRGEDGFRVRKEHDRRKKEYAKEHGIKLLEIWYNEDIEQKLKETLNLETLETAGV